MAVINEKLKAALPQLSMDTLGKLDRGAVARRVNDAISLCLANISKFPCRDAGKVETRKVTVDILMTPVVKAIKQGVEVNGRQQEVDAFDLVGITTRVKVKSGLPDAESADVTMLCEIQNGTIRDVRFNPTNNSAPDQMELAYDDDEHT